MTPKRQFWTLFISAFFTFNLIYLFYYLHPLVNPTILESHPTDSTLNLIADQTNLLPNQEFTVTLKYSLAQPAHFIQALIEYDPKIIKPILPEEKLHSLPFHKIVQPADNQVKITANSINPLNLLTNKQTLANTGQIVKIKFKVITDQATTTQLKFITSPNDQTDWDKTNLIFLNKNLSITQLLTEALPALKLNIQLPTPTPSPITSSQPETKPTASLSAYLITTFEKELFPMIASQASEIIEASPSSTSTKLSHPLFPSPETSISPSEIISQPQPISKNQPNFVQKVILLLNQVLEFLGSLSLNRS